MNPFLGSLVLLPIEKIVNAIKDRDPHIAKQFSPFDGKCVEVLCTQPPFTLSLRFEDDAIRLSAIDSETLGIEADATIAGSLEKLFGLLVTDPDRRALAASGIDISGDATLVQDLHQATTSLDIDWQDYLAPILGDVASHELGEIDRQLRDWGKSAGENLHRSVRDYLTEEARIAPSAREVESFSNRLDQLRLGVDRSAARMELMARRIELLGESK